MPPGKQTRRDLISLCIVLMAFGLYVLFTPDSNFMGMKVQLSINVRAIGYVLILIALVLPFIWRKRLVRTGKRPSDGYEKTVDQSRCDGGGEGE